MATEEKCQKLMKLLKAYPHPNHEGDDHKETLVGVCLAAEIYGWIDEFIRICEENPNAALDDILALIFTEERFPPLEIVDDETGEILGYGYEGNFPDKQGD